MTHKAVLIPAHCRRPQGTAVHGHRRHYQHSHHRLGRYLTITTIVCYRRGNIIQSEASFRLLFKTDCLSKGHYKSMNDSWANMPRCEHLLNTNRKQNKKQNKKQKNKKQKTHNTMYTYKANGYVIYLFKLSVSRFYVFCLCLQNVVCSLLWRRKCAH